jgi:hypothetical protein
MWTKTESNPSILLIFSNIKTIKGMCLEQGFSKCGMRTTSGMPATVQWYMGLVRKYKRIKRKKIPSVSAVSQKSCFSFKYIK